MKMFFRNVFIKHLNLDEYLRIIIKKKILIINLCLNTVEKFFIKSTLLDSSVKAKDNDYFVFLSQEQTNADFKVNLIVIQFSNDKTKFLFIRLIHYLIRRNLFNYIL